MPFKPFAHLARVGLAKGVAHVYAPGAVVAGQQGLGSFQNYPVSKFSKSTSHVQNAFSTVSGSSSGSGAGAKTSYATTNNTGDASLVSYFAAFNHAQQTGDDTEFQKHKSSRLIEWKPTGKNASGKQQVRLDWKPADILRNPVRVPISRSQSENIALETRSAEEEASEAQARAVIDDLIKQEIKDVHTAALQRVREGHLVVEEVDESLEVASSAEVDLSRTPSTAITSPVVSESITRSEEIIELGEQSRYADIPAHFQSMVKDGLVPSVTAYNYILRSAITLADDYQVHPRALQIYGDMISRSIRPNHETYQILIPFLTAQSLEFSKVDNELQKHITRYGQGHGSFITHSVDRNRQLYVENLSVQYVARLYRIARRELPDFSLSEAQYANLVFAYKRSGMSGELLELVSDMQSVGVAAPAEFYVSIIDACAKVQDLSKAKDSYQGYRDIAISRNTADVLDTKVYTSLIRAYYACGAEEDGLRFFEKILQSFEGANNQTELTQALTDSFVIEGLVQHYVDTGNLHQALESLKAHELTEEARAKGINRILTTAADQDHRDLATSIFTGARAAELNADTFMAVAAMHFRAGNVVEAKAAWARSQHPASINFATMYGLSFIAAGKIEEGLAEVLNMFRSIRIALPEASRHPVNQKLDESISFLGQSLSGEDAVYSSRAAILAFRIMIENGGLVPEITQAAIARVGPECVQVLNEQDIALALHVQAYLLASQAYSIHDVAQIPRFAHLLETVLERRIGMDPSTVHAIDTALPKLASIRPDLELRWLEWRRPPQQMVSPVTASTPATDHSHSYDPYSHTTDHRASRTISETLDSTSGRIETHLSDALARLKNVRRMGRHLQYSAYAKLITAAGKARQASLMHEILGMAQTDVPFNGQITAVRNGWTAIYDSMVAACLSIGDRKLATKFHEELLSMGAAPSANTFGIYITTLSDTNTLDEATEAVKIFQRATAEGVTPTVFLFNAVIGKLGKARRIDDCLQYFGQMQNLGIRPSSVTYGTLVNALCRTSEESFAVEMFDEMEAAPNYRPRPAPYNSIIQYFLNTKRDRSKVLQYYGRMRSRNIKPTSHTYKLLIESYATLEPVNLAAAETVLEDMKANGVMPESVHYGSLIHAKGCVLSDLAGARAVFDSVIADPNIKPTDNLYQNLLEAMVANHAVSDTPEVLADMKSRNISMTPYIANTLIHGWSGVEKIEMAKGIYDSLGREKREPSTYETMTRAYLNAEDREAALVVVREMLGKGYPSAVTDKVVGLVGGV